MDGAFAGIIVSDPLIVDHFYRPVLFKRTIFRLLEWEPTISVASAPKDSMCFSVLRLSIRGAYPPIYFPLPYNTELLVPCLHPRTLVSNKYDGVIQVPRLRTWAHAPGLLTGPGSCGAPTIFEPVSGPYMDEPVSSVHEFERFRLSMSEQKLAQNLTR